MDKYVGIEPEKRFGSFRREAAEKTGVAGSWVPARICGAREPVPPLPVEIQLERNSCGRLG